MSQNTARAGTGPGAGRNGRNRNVIGAFRRRGLSAAAAVAVVVGTASGVLAATPAQAVVGNGMNITAGDLDFVLKQILIAERHSAAFGGDAAVAPQPNPHPAADPSYCLSLVGPANDQVPDALTSYGLRTVDGACNNITDLLATTNALADHAVATFDNHPSFGAADQPFPRLTNPVFRDAEGSPPGFPPAATSSYKQKLSDNIVYDSQPRLISNLIVDQTSTNPAAVAAAGHPQRSQSSTATAVPCTTDPDPTAVPPVVGVPAGCTPSHHTLFIPNITTDTGLSPPFNSLFTFFGQFFDHGVDQTVKSSGTVFVPLRADDPLIAGPDHVFGNADDLPASQRFMALTRAQNQPGPDGVIGTGDDVQDANNTDSPWVDLSQDYASHSAHQVFLREYRLDAAGHPQSTGRFLSHADGGMPTWKDVKDMAATDLGLLLADKDVLAVPQILTDPYGNFVPGPARGLPQYVTASGLVEGNLASPVPVPSDVRTFDTPFLTDVAHNADPSPQDTDHNPATPPVAPVRDESGPNHDFAKQPAGTYDGKLLDSHAICGDGRCNENIALTTIHGIFHAEHNRLDGGVPGADPATFTPTAATCPASDPNPTILCILSRPANAGLLARYKAAHLDGAGHDIGYGFGGRLFQAARFLTEMQYQHIVFEEFARKVQPLVRAFHVYSPDINPATTAEFAHAVYRFGHSMLDETIARTTPVGTGPAFESTELLDGFLNPPELRSSKACPAICTQDTDADHGMAAIIMGSSDQTGNEIDEFVTETLRNNLLGLPLDLPTLNLTRARSEGVPPLNQVRRQLLASTNDSQLTPYTSWADFGQHLKHPESLVNFVAAYGTHPSITSESTIAGRRAAARAIVDPLPTDTVPADASDFLFGTGTWANAANALTKTGLDDVDLWVGGLAEATNQNGGMLGSTFNYVFQTQLENLQDGDRLYYLNRTPGMNFRTQLEGNSFAELIQRNVPGTSTLKADAFARADCKFELGNLTFPATTGITGAGSVADDPASACDENALLLQMPDGTIQYRANNTVDPSGINGQSVYNGTPGADKVFGGVDNDTVWGGDGNDTIEGNNGDDVALGGNGDDVITDLNGADVPKGGPGNDAIDAGPGDDIPMGNAGKDFVNAGQGDNETFAGEGDDFVIAGGGADAVFGDGGDDWIEGGTGQDLLQGDHGAPFFDDPGEPAPGNDFFVGQPGENDYDAEGGDDVMSQNAAIDRNAGAGGFDWAFHQYDGVAANDDMMINNNLGGLPIQVVVNRDRWQETEADSGGPLNDVIKGTDGVLGTPKFITGGGFTGCDAVDAAGLARITGFDQVLPPIASWTTDAAELNPLAAAGRCPLTGPVWGDGDVLLGGPGSDTFTGRTGDDVIDGDKFLRIAITVRANADGTGGELGRTDLMEHAATSGTFGTGTDGMTLQQAVFARLVNPGQLVAVREIVTPPVAAPDCGAQPAVNCDVAVFSGPRAQYTITPNADGTITVLDTTSVPATAAAPATGDGADRLRNVEQLRFTDQTVSLVPTASVTPTSIAFPDTQTGASAQRTITVSNPGLAPLTVSGVALTGTNAGDFSMTSGCTLVVVAPGGSCSVTVTFAPTAVGAKEADVVITHNGTGSPVTVHLTGTGTAPAAVATLTPTSLSFPDTFANVTSAAQTVTVRNTGTVPLHVSGVTVTGTDAGSFPTTNTCTAAVAPGATCTVSVTFAPTSAGAKTAVVTLAHDGVGGTSTVTVSGTALADLIGLAPSALAFGNQNVASTSAARTTVLSNIGTVPVTTTAVTIVGPDASSFLLTAPAGCVRTRAAGLAYCTISVRFRPTSAGPKTAQLRVTSTNGGTAVAQLSGTGVAVATITSTTLVAFGRHPLNSTTTVPVTITNSGTAPLTSVAVSTTGSAAYSAAAGTCAGATVQPGSSCTVNVTFHPTVAGNPLLGTLTITSNASNNPRTVTLTGRAP